MRSPVQSVVMECIRVRISNGIHSNERLSSDIAEWNVGIFFETETGNYFLRRRLRVNFWFILRSNSKYGSVSKKI